MKIYKVKNYEEMSKKAADILSAQVTLKPESVLGLATGATSIGIYEKLVKNYNDRNLDFSGICSVNLDEYVGLSEDNSQSYRHFMNESLFNHVNIKIENTFIPNGMNFNSKDECEKYDNIIKTLNKIDLQLLGLGRNGHIGFNEPDDKFTKGTNLVDLKQETVEANKHFFESESQVPKQAYTMGIKSIIQAEKILLAVNGEAKADILYEVLYGPITPFVPASILQMHKDVIIVADEAALSKCKLLNA
jgi:glucosamine-6-phosphate isomerase